MTALRTPQSIETPAQMLEKNVMHRVTILQQNFDNADPQKLAIKLTEANLEQLDQNSRKVLMDLIPLAGALMVPEELEDIAEAKCVLDQLGTNESNENKLELGKNQETNITDEDLKNAISGFRSLFMVLEAFGLDNLPERTIHKLRAAMATLISETSHPLPPELLDKLTYDDYQALKKHLDASDRDTPDAVQKATTSEYNKLLGITNGDPTSDNMENKLYNSYLEFMETYGDPALVTTIILPPEGLSEES